MPDIVVDGMTRVAFVPTITTRGAATVAQMNAGTLLQTFLIPTGLEGWEPSNADIDNTSLASTFDTKLPGRLSYSGTGLVFKKQDGTDVIFNLLTTPNTNGYICIRDGVPETQAWAAGDKYEEYFIRTGTHAILGRGEANSLLRFRVPTPIQAAPALKGVVAA